MREPSCRSRGEDGKRGAVGVKVVLNSRCHYLVHLDSVSWWWMGMGVVARVLPLCMGRSATGSSEGSNGEAYFVQGWCSRPRDTEADRTAG